MRRKVEPLLCELNAHTRWSDGALTRRAGRSVDRSELFNRNELFAWVAEHRLPAVANGDFHELAHPYGWKTLLPCAKDERAVVGYLRSTGRRSRRDDVPLRRAA